MRLALPRDGEKNAWPAAVRNKTKIGRVWPPNSDFYGLWGGILDPTRLFFAIRPDLPRFKGMYSNGAGPGALAALATQDGKRAGKHLPVGGF